MLITTKIVMSLADLALQITGKPWLTVKPKSTKEYRGQYKTTDGTVFHETKKRDGRIQFRISAARKAAAYLIQIIDLHDERTGQKLGDPGYRDHVVDTNIVLRHMVVGREDLEKAREKARVDYTEFCRILDAAETVTPIRSCGCIPCADHA